MANGTISLPSTDSRLEGRIIWESSNNGPVANSSTVVATMQILRNDGYTTTGNWDNQLTVNGEGEADTFHASVNNSAWVTVASRTVYGVKHNDNGTGTCPISGWCYGPKGTSLSGKKVEGGATVSLDTIPRYANFLKHEVKKITIHSIQILYKPDRTITGVQYSLNGGEWKNANVISGIWDSPNNDVIYEIKELTANTKYTIKTRIQCNGLWAESAQLKPTTYDIAKISSVNNANIGDSQTIKWTNPSNASLRLKLCRRNNNGNILTIIDYGTVTGTSKTVTPTASTLYDLTPNSNQLSAFYLLTTTLDGISDTNSKDCIFYVTNSNPTFSDFTFKDTNSKTIALTGSNQKFIKNYSNLQATISVDNKAVAKNSATMKAYSLNVGTKNSGEVNYSDSEEVNLSVSSIDNNSIFVTAKDSRQNTTSAQKIISTENYLEYVDLKITKCIPVRGSGGAGKAVTLEYAGEFWNNSFGEVENAISSIKYEYRVSGTEEWIEGGTTLSPTTSGNSFFQTISIQGDLQGAGFNDSNNYDIRLTVSDKLSSKNISNILGAGIPLVAYHKNGLAIGGKYDTFLGGALQIYGNLNVKKGDIVLEGSQKLQVNENAQTNATVPTSGCGICSGKDGASNTDANMKFYSWYGIGFSPSQSSAAIPRGENAFYINCRNGNFTARGKGYTSKGEIPAPREVVVAGVNRKTWTVSGSWGKVNLLPLQSNNHSGSGKLTYTTNGIKIGSGVTKVLASALFKGIDYSKFLGDVYVNIVKKRGANELPGAEGYNTHIDTGYFSMDIPPTILDVAENDLLYLAFGCGAGGTGELLGASFCVEVLE